MAIASNAQNVEIFIGNGTATTFTLPIAADYVQQVVVVTPGTDTTVTTYTATSAAASSTNVNFNGAPEAPGATLTFATAPADNALILVPYLPAGTL